MTQNSTPTRSRTRLTLLFAAASLIALGACDRDDGASPGESDNSLLAHVPAGTPYLSANLQPVPDEIIDRYLDRAAPVLEAMQAELSEARTRLEATPDSANPAGRLAVALLTELDGKLNRDGLESLGFDLQAPRAFYGLGAFPVIRMGLADPDALRATVQRVLERSGMPAPQHQRQGVDYWRVPLGEPGASGAAAALYVSILDDQLAAGLFPAALEDESLAHLLGQTLPSESDAAERLGSANERYGYTPYGTGEVDLVALADELMRDDSRAGRALRQAGIDVPALLGPDCPAEIRAVLANVPRVVSGLTELDADAMGYRVVFETEQTLGTRLASLVAPVPTVDPESDRVLEFALGLRVGAVRDFLREKAAAVAETPYRCEHLTDLNRSAAEAYTQLNQPVPPMVNNFEGLRLSLSRAGRSPASPEHVEGVVAIHVEQPQMFVGMARMFLPGLAELELTPGGDPVRLPPDLVPLPGVVAYAALSDDAIGLSVGPGEQDRLEDFLEESADADGIFMSVNYDTAMYLDYTDEITSTFSEQDTDPDAPGRNLAEAVQEAWKSMAGRTDTRAAFTPGGVVIDSRMTFKD